MKKNDVWSVLAGEKAKYTVYCICSCPNRFYPFLKETKKVCRWCNRTVYLNEKEKFKDLLSRKSIQLKKENL